jgi:hypothetical protein
MLRQILSSELSQRSSRNRLWTLKLVQATDEDARRALVIAKAIVHMLSSRTIVFLVERDAVPLFTQAGLHRLGVEPLRIPGPFQYYAASEIPDRMLFRRKKANKCQLAVDATIIVDLRTTWLELLPYEVRHMNGKLVLRGASWLERLRLQTERDIMHIGHPEKWKKTAKKDRRALDYCSITVFDRILAVNLLRKDFMKLTPRATYSFHGSDSHVRQNSPKRLHSLILGVSTRNRYRYSPIRSATRGDIPSTRMSRSGQPREHTCPKTGRFHSTKQLNPPASEGTSKKVVLNSHAREKRAPRKTRSTIFSSCYFFFSWIFSVSPLQGGWRALTVGPNTIHRHQRTESSRVF